MPLFVVENDLASLCGVPFVSKKCILTIGFKRSHVVVYFAELLSRLQNKKKNKSLEFATVPPIEAFAWPIPTQC